MYQPIEELHNEDNLPKVENTTEQSKNTAKDSALHEEARHLAHQLFGNETEKCDGFTNRLLDICSRAQGKDFLLIHNPGGWGTTKLEHCLQWERSIVAGISTTLDRLGYTWLLIQYFRTGSGWGEHIRDVKEQFRFFASKAKMMAAEVEFLVRYTNNLQVILIGISQGAVFGNSVMQCLSGPGQAYSIELGMLFTQRSRRVVTNRTLAIDSNGLMPDAIMEWNIITMLKTFLATPFRWIKYRLEGKPRKFSHCINVPGHEYNWEHPEVRQQIEDFIQINLGTKSDLEGSL